jgi:DNA-binding NtrC family response regulator
VKWSIFYLDDEELLLRLFEEMFGHLYDIRTSSSPTEARRMLANCDANIIISDQKMPGLEGTDFLREAARACPRSYRILLTGQTAMIQVVTELTTGIVQHFMVKPWTEEEMLEALKRAIATIERNR